MFLSYLRGSGIELAYVHDSIVLQLDAGHDAALHIRYLQFVEVLRFWLPCSLDIPKIIHISP